MQTIKTWQERTRESLHPSVAPNLSDDELSIVGTKHMLSYIADLESALASQAERAPVALDGHYRSVIASVCEGWNISADLRKYLESELFVPAAGVPHIERDAALSDSEISHVYYKTTGQTLRERDVPEVVAFARAILAAMAAQQGEKAPGAA